MDDPRRPVDIASFATEVGANLFAGLLRGEGIEAAVFGNGVSFTGLVQDCRDWRLLVPAEEAERARQVVLDARERFAERAGLQKCPGCAYSLEGLSNPERCPECGRELDTDRELAKIPEFVLRESDPAGAHRAWGILLAIFIACGVLGLVAFVVLRD